MNTCINCYNILGNDRKKEGPPIQSMIPSKKPKLAAHAMPAQRPTISYTETWEVMAMDCEPADLVPMVLEANDNDEGEKLIGLICGAIKNLRNTKYKPDNVICMGLLYLVKVRPSIFDHQCILHGLASLLKKDSSHQSYKNKNTSMLPVLVANLLMRGFQDKREWPIDFIKVEKEH